MAKFRYKDSTVKAVVYFKHPSGRKDKWQEAIYEVDEQEYARLQEAFSAFEKGQYDEDFFVLQLINGHQVKLRLDEVSGIVHRARELVVS